MRATRSRNTLANATPAKKRIHGASTRPRPRATTGVGRCADPGLSNRRAMCLDAPNNATGRRDCLVAEGVIFDMPTYRPVA